jgi:hypothetical protein
VVEADCRVESTRFHRLFAHVRSLEEEGMLSVERLATVAFTPPLVLGEAKSGAATCTVRLRMHTVASVRIYGNRRSIFQHPPCVIVLKVFRNFQMHHRTKMLYCMKYIKLIVQLSRHFCGVGRNF